MGKPRLPEKTKLLVRSLLLDGLSTQEICSQAKVSHSTVSRIKRTYNPESKGKRQPRRIVSPQLEIQGIANTEIKPVNPAAQSKFAYYHSGNHEFAIAKTRKVRFTLDENADVFKFEIL
jgi:transposase